MVDLFTIEAFLAARECEEMIAELRSREGEAALVYGGKESRGSVDPHVRKVRRVVVSSPTRERVVERLRRTRQTLESHFALTLGECEEPQFLHYKTGDFFVAHQDGNTPLVYDQTRFRKISVVIFLSQQTVEPAAHGYGGGELVFHGGRASPALRLPVSPSRGALMAFRAETTHEVTPVTHGDRYTIVSWFR